MALIGKNPSAIAASSLITPKRTTTVWDNVTQYDWWLVYWSDRTVACAFSVNHDGIPSDDEIRSSCTDQLYNAWIETPTCASDTDQSTKKCSGLYLRAADTPPANRRILTYTDPPTVTMTLDDCIYESDDLNYCTGEPTITFTGVEPLADQKIVSIRGSIAGTSFRCEDSICSQPLPVTGVNGEEIKFRGDSSFGDSTEQFIAYFRVIPAAEAPGSYYVEVISDLWQGRKTTGCSDIWQLFPESITPPNWLETPIESEELESSINLYYLAAALINNGIVDASYCENGGLAISNAANECGVTAAADAISEWQNQFDEEILEVAQSDGIPARLLKNIFIRESQLWPGVYQIPNEMGFGQLTENGADTVLLWNQEFYNSFCPLIFDRTVCRKGYAHLELDKQNTLKGALITRTNATCLGCENGIDETKADYSIHVFASTLRANCSQVNQIIKNVTRHNARTESSYSDLWRFTLVNYNAGPGCLWTAISRTWKVRDPIDWHHVAANLDQVCRPAIDYVIDVTDGDSGEIYVFSTPESTEEPTEEMTSTPSPTPSPTPTLTPTVTQSS